MASGVCWRASAWIPSAAFGRPPGLPDTPGRNDVRDLATPLGKTDQHHSIPSRTAAMCQCNSTSCQCRSYRSAFHRSRSNT